MDKKLVIVINGRGGIGKDTLVKALDGTFRIMNESSIEPIKDLARKYGWNEERDDKSRLFLARLKRAFIDYNDLPNNYLIEKYKEFLNSDKQIFFAHIREKEEIEKFIASIDIPCVTLLIKRDNEHSNKAYGNEADDLVNDYTYDYEFVNNASIEVSSKLFREFIKDIYNNN